MAWLVTTSLANNKLHCMRAKSCGKRQAAAGEKLPPVLIIDSSHLSSIIDFHRLIQVDRLNAVDIYTASIKYC
eukprot:scaffold1033_cov141-Skeletonema_marinoi.AAC.12